MLAEQLCLQSPVDMMLAGLLESHSQNSAEHWQDINSVRQDVCFLCILLCGERERKESRDFSAVFPLVC